MVFVSHLFVLPIMERPKDRITHPYLLWIIAFLFLEFVSVIVLHVVGDFNGLAGTILLATSSIVYGAVFIYTGSELIARNLFLFAAYCTFYMFAAGFSLAVSILPFIPANHSEMVMSLTLMLICFCYALLLRFHLREFILDSLSKLTRELWILAVFGAVTFISVSCIVLIPLFFLVDEIYASIALTLIMFILAVSAYSIVFQIIRIMSARNDTAMLNERLNMLRNELESEKAYIESARRFRHDRRHHNRIMLEYIAQGRIEEAKGYIMKYDEQLSGKAVSDR